MKQNFIFASAAALLGLSSCISSQEAYDKAKLSDFVAAQTTQLIEDKAGAKHSMSEAELDRMVVESSSRVKVLDTDMAQVKSQMSELQEALEAIDALEAEAQAEFERSNVTTVFFASGSSVLTADGMQALYNWKSAMDRGATSYNYTVEIYASTDKTGSSAGNAKLRDKRAESVRKFLVGTLGMTGAINVVTTQPAQMAVLSLDRRVVVSVKVNN
ncbi:MAG: OmpA family protein [Bacteroidia bacterium]